MYHGGPISQPDSNCGAKIFLNMEAMPTKKAMAKGKNWQPKLKGWCNPRHYA